jgi:hypothetical protein
VITQPKTEEELRARSGIKPTPEQIKRAEARQAQEAEAEAEQLAAKETTKAPVADDDWGMFQKATRSLIKDLKVEGKKSMATMSPHTVAYLVGVLARLIDRWAEQTLEAKRKPPPRRRPGPCRPYCCPR